jgi:predicted RNA-binding protein associated with RNAse of E/G family
LKVTEPLFVSYGEKKIRIVDDGYMWLQQFPLKEKHSVTTMFDKSGNVVQWYIDICLENGMEKGIPYMDDLYLDIVVLPSGEVIEKDADELEQAFLTGVIDKPLYDIAWNEAVQLIRQIENKEFGLLDLSKTHKELLSIELN